MTRAALSRMSEEAAKHPLEPTALSALVASRFLESAGKLVQMGGSANLALHLGSSASYRLCALRVVGAVNP